jgi:hypothetical protein
MVAKATMKENWTEEWGIYRFDDVEGFGNRVVKPGDIHKRPLSCLGNFLC